MKVKVTETGVVIPKEFLVGVAEVEIRKEHDIIVVIPAAKEDPVFKLGLNPVACNAPDASENPDQYLYAFDQ